MARVLFVDDSHELLKAMHRQFRNERFSIMSTSNPEAALSIIERTAVEILVVDEQMPRMRGTKLLELVAERRPQVINIMLTGNPSMPLMKELLNKQRVFRFHTKPYRLDELRASIYEAIDLSRTFKCCAEMLGERSVQGSELVQLEQQYPGITHVSRNENGAVLLDCGEERELGVVDRLPSGVEKSGRGGV